MTFSVHIQEIENGFVVDSYSSPAPSLNTKKFYKTFEEVIKAVEWLYKANKGERYFTEEDEHEKSFVRI